MTVSAIAWRLTANDAPSWRLMLGLSRSTSSNLANGLLATTSCPTGLNLIAGPGAGQCAGAATAGGIVADDPNNAVCEPRRFLGLTRLPGSPVGAAGCAPNATGASGAGYPRIGPPMHPHHLAHVPGSPAYNAAAAAAAAMMYPEFQFRPPPPSYQASMQEYRLRLLLLDRHHSAPPAVSPPPTYRSNTSTLRPGLTLGRESDVSRPPSYRSRSSSVVPRPLPTDGAPSSSSQQTSPRHPNGAHPSAPHHSRDASLTVSLFQVNGQESVVVTVPGLGRGQQTVSGASRGGPLLIPNINAISGSQILNVVARV
ncbi:unnamed protein product [Notodromas monacha]|uniref:Uncharacterized protein n=1 Tax=Notodromas monacha TaxID=399045 RepID=A0A7R9BP51_9CRUS|nr:unnamed protein product [Notodromas monacha]CAG0918236.1 unnamed protein product [Notodromas monacha]